ncbi:MAG: TAT-variant-translocated molybdopterin oxidoreductase [Planctomycetota bacterium]
MSEAHENRGSLPPLSGRYWRSLDQLADTEEFRSYVEREFPEGVAEAPDEVTRRGFLGVVAASAALAGLASCRKPVTHIMPFDKRQEGYRPGLSETYATTLTRSGYGLGVLVRANDGRPTKIEGNPLHPGTLGGADALLQAELLNLYDPGRSKAPRGPAGAEPGASPEAEGHGRSPDATQHSAFAAWWEGLARAFVAKQGEGLRLVVAPDASPSMAAAKERLLDVFPRARFHSWTPLHRDEEILGSKAAFGRAVETLVDFEKADIVLALDCDFLALDGPNLRSARAWAKRRRAGTGSFSRLYAVESTFSTTGTAADHRFRLRSSGIPGVALALAAELGVDRGGPLGNALASRPRGEYRKNGKDWLSIAARDLAAHRGRAVVVAGPRMPAWVHALVHAINESLGSTGSCVTYTDMPEALAAPCVRDLTDLCRDIAAEKVETLIFLDSNPVYDAPPDLAFAEALARVPHSVHLGLYEDETGQRCTWHINMAHELESWGDAWAIDGTISLRQPLIAPLHGGLSAIEFLAWIRWDAVNDRHPFTREREGAAGHDLVKGLWKERAGSEDFERWWAQSLHDGVIADSRAARASVRLDMASVAAALPESSAVESQGYEVCFRPDIKMWDGRNANNSWMQELPDPLTKLTWDNAALISIASARELEVENGDYLEITVGTSPKVRVPAWILPGHADKSITLALGYGRSLPPDCRVAKGAGHDVGPLRKSSGQWIASASVAKGSGSYPLVCTQDHGTMAGRAIVRENTVEANRLDPQWAPKMSALDKIARLEGATEKDLTKSLWTERGYEKGKDSPDPQVAASPYQWGMVIDLSVCTGCSACVTACVAENNIPMVGKVQVSRNREMFWIRADRYFSSLDETYDGKLEPAEDPQVSNQPVPCMQCENAPCESVCPVAATTHSPDGLNDMVYNRCIGTRYCSNNCPYKVRRFNYLDYHKKVPETEKLALNPDVTVRSRGVMEKCTYCVQRINAGRIQAKLEGRRVRDGEITPACAQGCPTQAITFGDILDPTTEVSRLKAMDLNYGVLASLNTKPRTTYLGRIRNPNPELA